MLAQTCCIVWWQGPVRQCASPLVVVLQSVDTQEWLWLSKGREERPVGMRAMQTLLLEVVGSQLVSAPRGCCNAEYWQ
jgi:hypothetical protein